MTHDIKQTLGSWLIFALALPLPTCSSDDGDDLNLTEEQKTLCDDSCDKLKKCDPVEFGEGCMDDCSTMASFMRESVFESIGECIAEASCAEVDPDGCMEQAAMDVPDSVLDDFFASICGKMGECGGNATSCAEEFSSDEDTAGFKIISDNKLDCVADCIGNLTCNELQKDGDEVFGSCAKNCGIEMGDGEGGDGQDCGFIQGEWKLESVSCNGVEQDLGDAAVFQNIDQNCSGTGEMSFGQCQMSQKYTIEIANGGATWVAESIDCGGGCSEDACTDMPEADFRIDMSINPTGSQLIFSYKVDKTVIDAGMSPCQEGDSLIAVYGISVDFTARNIGDVH